jgi:hypothetical protein
MRREGIGWSAKRVERVHRKIELNPAAQKRRRIPDPEKRPLVQPDLKSEALSMDFVEDGAGKYQKNSNPESHRCLQPESTGYRSILFLS